MYKNGIKLETIIPVTMKETIIEPEEGEIIDDYERISSDEEFSVMQRIRQLEEENAEIEQIAVISRSYDIDRAARVPSDASSISSTEFKTPKKRKRHKNKEHKKKICHHEHSSTHYRYHGSCSHIDKKNSRSRKSRCKRREKLLKKKHTRTFSKDLRDNLLMGSPDSLNSSISSLSFTDSDGSCRHMCAEDARDDQCYYRRPDMRDTLRLAIARSRKNSARASSHNVDLKERLLRKDMEFTGNQYQEIEDDEDDVVICEPVPEIHYVPDDSMESLEESELRLIALKSAVLKKHMERKRRNAEVAYSPTDLDDLMSSCVVETDDKLVDLEVVDLDDDDSQNISPVASPHFAILDCLDDSSQMVNCKPVDMDIANSDSEEAPVAPTVSNNLRVTTPNIIPYPNYPPSDLGSTYPFGLYIPDFNTNSLNPPPPGVDDYEDVKQVKTINYVKNEMDAQDMDVENDDFVPIETFPTTCSIRNNKESLTTQELKMNGETSPTLYNNRIDEDTHEEEEQALRALLLSKFNSPKNQKKKYNPPPSNREVEKENILEDQINTDHNRNEVKPTEAILKEAVKRLKVVGMCKTNVRHENISTREQPSIFDQQKDICVNISPALRDQTHHQHESGYDVPEPQIDTDAGRSLNQQHNLKTLQCLKKKVKELKKNKDVKLNHDSGHQNLSKFANHVVKAEVPDNVHMNMDIEININPTELENTNIKPLTLNTNVVNNINIKMENTELGTYCEPTSKSLTILDEDTKRRLQRLKEEILLVTQNKLIGPSEEVDNKHSNLTLNNAPELVTVLPPNTEEKTDFTAETMDGIDKETTWQEEHKVSQEEYIMNEVVADVTNISKRKPLNPNELKATDVSLNKIALKKNNLNKENKNITKLKSDIVVSIKNSLESKKNVRTVCSIKSQQVTSSAKNLKAAVSTAATVTPIQDALVKPIPIYSMVRATKIVKPNKVINRNVDLKRKVVLEKSKPPPANVPTKIAKGETAETSAALKTTAKPIDNSRLITSMDQVRHMCTVAQFVISLQQSSNESSDDELVNCDSMYKPLYEYNDIKSPLSLNLESPCVTPGRMNSPVDGVAKENATSVNKLKRSPISFPGDTDVPVSTLGINIQKTPVAVRHLPAAAQDEYRKLVNRMKLLENQRLKKESLNVANESSSANQENYSNSVSTPAVKPTLVKQVLLKNTNDKSSSASLLTGKKTTAALRSEVICKPHKANVLRAYESLYAKIGAGIMHNLDKSLNYVEEAKRAKINKLKLAARLKKLKEEMEFLQARYKEEEQKISRIYPSICSTNEVITSMKQKRSKVFKAAINLGKSLKGDDYRLNNEHKQNITNKSQKLASDIKMVNSLKAEDIDKLHLGGNVPNGIAIEHPVDTTNCQESSIKIEIVPAKSCENEKDNIEIKNQGNFINNLSATNAEGLSNVSINNISDAVQDDDDEQNCNENMNPRINDNARNSDENNEDKKIEDSMLKSDRPNLEATNSVHGVTQQFQKRPSAADQSADTNAAKGLENCTTCNKENADVQMDQEDNSEAENSDSKGLLSYTSPLDHLRNINGIVDPNGVVCPYDLMGNCEDAACKYVHISPKDADLAGKVAA